MITSMERGWKPNVEISPNCPRCGSSNTKFCYYNNYSLTQPRYFCKHCRRYWTKGGSLRNVPVGGGCRKNRRTKSLTLTPSPSTPQKNQVFNNDNNSVIFESRKNRDGSSSQDIDLAIVYANFLNQNKPHSKDQLKPCDEFDPCFQFSANDNLLMGDHENGVFGIRSGNFCEFPMKEYGNLGEMDQDENMACFEKKKNEIELAPLPGEDIVVGWSNSALIMVNNNHSMQPTCVDMLGMESQDPNLLSGNWSPIDFSSYDTFSRA